MNRILRSQLPQNPRDLAVFDTTTGSSQGRTRWSNFSLWGIAFLLVLSSFGAKAQFTPTTYNFNANSTGWTGNILRTTATTACGSASMRRNMYSTVATGNMVSPLIPGSTAGNWGGEVTISYKYKVANWSANTVGTNPWGSFNVQYGATATGPWTTFATVSQETQNGTCITKTHTFTPPAGNLYIKWDAFWTAGDYYINFDDVVLSQLAPLACSGTPNIPVAVLTGSNNVCAGVTKTMTASGFTGASGLTTQWMVSNTPGGPYTNVSGGTGATTNSYDCDFGRRNLLLCLYIDLYIYFSYFNLQRDCGYC